ncbi:MAG: hypothetical protein JWN15_2733, partial [Firmicutes bacterium]|nr:hypothetical protein [Bacillota bacterium]
SDRYLALARSRPEMARYLSVGSPLIFVDGKAAYAVDIPGKEESNFAIPVTVSNQPGPTAARPALALGLWIGGGAAAGVAGVVAWRRRRRPR